MPSTEADAGGSVDSSQCAKADGSSPKVQQFAVAPPQCLVNGKTYKATIVTTQGTLHVLLRADIAPNTVNSFVNLARYHYFDNTTCHRAIKNFVVQCGDPTATGGGGPGYEFDDELDKIEPSPRSSSTAAPAAPGWCSGARCCTSRACAASRTPTSGACSRTCATRWPSCCRAPRPVRSRR